MALLGVVCLVQGGMLLWERGALEASEFERVRCAQDLKAREDEAETLSADVTRLVVEKEALEGRLREADRPVGDRAKGWVCEVDKLQWIARIEPEVPSPRVHGPRPS